MKLLLLIVVFTLSWLPDLSAQVTDTILVDIDTLSSEEATELGYRNYRIPNRLYISNYNNNVERPLGKTVYQDEIFPIGLSEDGKFAYALEPHAENCDCYYAEFYIVDLANNSEVLFFRHYDDEMWQRAWDKANTSQKDSLRDVHRCSYLKCAWYEVYDALSAKMFEYDIYQPKRRNYYGFDLEDEQKFSRIEKDTTDNGFSFELNLFFEHDTDTIRINHETRDTLSGMNYHGYLHLPVISDYYVVLLSDRFLGLDTSLSEVWHYHVAGFKRNKDLPYEKSDLSELSLRKNSQNRVPHAYRKITLVEQMYDRVVNSDMEDWLRKNSYYLDVSYYDNSDGIFPYQRDYGGRSSSFRKTFVKEGNTYHLDRSFSSSTGGYFLFGRKKDGEKSVNRLTQLIHYNSDSSDVDFWYDLSSEVRHRNGGIRYVQEEDSLLYIAIGSDFTEKEAEHYGRIYCINTNNHRVQWVSEEQTSNAESFTLQGDVIIAGYAVGEEDKNNKHKLVLINKYNGERVKEITLPDSPVWIVNDGERVHVKTPVSEHEFDIKSSFFETF